MQRINDTLYGLINSYTGEYQTYSLTTTWIDGSLMDDSKCDPAIFRKKGTEYFKLNYSGSVNPKWYGAKGDGVTNDTAAIQAAIDSFQTGTLINSGVDILFPRGIYLVDNLLVKSGTKLYANQMAKDNYIANVDVVIKAFSNPDYIIDVDPSATNYSIENLYIECDSINQPQLIAGVRLRGVKSYFIGNNVNAAAQVGVWNEAGLVYIEKNGIYGWYGAAPTFTGINDFRGALHCPALGDSYIYDNEIGAGLSYFTSIVNPRDPINGRICALFLGGIFGGTSVISGNLFENGDRACVIGNSLYCTFHHNRYELSAMGGLYIIGPMQYATFTAERFSGNSLTTDGAADDITIGIGAAGNLVFTTPIFESLNNGAIPNSIFKTRYHISNFGSTKIDLITPQVDSTYSTSGLVNLVDIGTLPIRQVMGQYDPNNPQYDSVSTQKLPAETQVGFTKITQGTDSATQSLVGSVQFWTPQNTIAYSIGFSPKEYLSFIGYEPNAIFAFNNDIALSKTGEAKTTIWSTDALGDSKIVLQGGALVSSQAALILNNTTEDLTITTSNDIVLGVNENFRLHNNGLTIIPFTPTIDTSSNCFLLGRNTITGEQTIIDPSVFVVNNITQTANTFYAGPTAGAPVIPVFRSIVAQDIPSLDASKITTGTIATTILGTGSPSSTTALFGDQTYKTVLTDGTQFIANQSITDILSSFRTQGTASIVPIAIGGGMKVNAGTSQLTIESGGAPFARVQLFTDGVSIVQLRVFDAFNKGFVYEGNYAAAGILDDRWIPDYAAVKAYANSLITGGTVTSVGLSLPSIFSVSGSPVTSTGTLTGTLATQTANTIFAGPSSGGATTPTFRSLVTSDLPSLTTLSILNQNTSDQTANFRINGTARIGGFVNIGSTTVPSSPLTVTYNSGNQLILAYNSSTQEITNVGSTGIVTRTASGSAPSFLFNNATEIVGVLTNTATTTQHFLRYDAGHYESSTVASNGSITRDLIGASPIFSFNKAVSITGVFTLVTSPATSAGTYNPLTWNTSTGVVEKVIGFDTAILTTGTVATARLGSGTANSTTYLAGDQTYKTIPSGSVTSVALSLPSIFSISGSPVTSSGTLTGTLVTQTANTVFAGPTTGGVITPTFRALVVADIPSLPFSQITGTVPTTQGGTGLTTIGTALQQIRVNSGGTGLEYFTSVSGTVTSVALSAPSVFSISGSPITSSGTLALSFATGQTANSILATPDGTTGALSLRTLVSGDIPNISAAKITSGILGIANGGTNLSALGSSLQQVRVNAGGSALEYFTSTDIASLNGLTTTSQTFALDQLNTAPTWTSTAGVHTLSLPLAGTGATSGMLSNTTQNIAGSKTFTTSIIASAGIQTGVTATSSNLYANVSGSGIAISSGITGLALGGVATASKTWMNGVTATTAAVNANFSNVIVGAGGWTTAASGTHPLGIGLAVKAPILTIGTATITNGISFYIEAAPTTGTTNWASYIAAGNAYYGGQLKIAGGTPGTGKYLQDSDGTGLAVWSTPTASIPLFDHISTIGNTTTTETDLYSDTTTASRLNANGEKLKSTYAGSFLGSGTATRQLKIYFGGTTIFDSGALAVSVSGDWDAEVTIIRTGSTTARSMVSISTTLGAIATNPTVTLITGLTFSSTNILKITGTSAGVGAATNDITAKLGTVSWIPASANVS